MKRMVAALAAVALTAGLSLAAVVGPAAAADTTPTPAPVASSTPTSTPTATPTSAPTSTPTATPTSTPTSSPTPSTTAPAVATSDFTVAATSNPPVSYATTYETIVWSLASGASVTSTDGDVTYPQKGVAQFKGEVQPTLDVAFTYLCGVSYQVDVYAQTFDHTDNTAHLDALYAEGLAGPKNGDQDGAYLAGAGSNPGVYGLGHAWKIVTASIPDSSVTYTYSADDSNSGVITVPTVAGSTGHLCTPFYVTATSWTYDNSSSVWPQTVDVVDHTNNTPSGALNVAISASGTYDYAAPVTCGQGDIYASVTQTDATLYPENDNPPSGPGILNNPHTPLPEHFLSDLIGDLGFHGPNPTYVQDTKTCIDVTPGDPTSKDAVCLNGVDQLGSITTDGNEHLTYTLFDSTKTVKIATFPSLPTDPTISGLTAGTYYVFVTGNGPYKIADGAATLFPFKITIAGGDCPTATPVVTSDAPVCQPDVTSTGFTAVDTEVLGTISVADQSNVTYTISNDGGAPVSISGASNQEPDGTYTIVATITATGIADGYTFASSPNYVRSQNNQVATFAVITFSSGCNLPTLATWNAGVTSTDATCSATSASDGTLDLTHDSNQTGKVTYKVVNNTTSAVVYDGTNTVAGDTIIRVAPGSYTVTAIPLPGDGIAGNLQSHPDSSEIFPPVTIAVVGTDCGDGTLAFTGGTIAWFGFVLAGGMLFLGIAFLIIRRRGNRTAQ